MRGIIISGSGIAALGVLIVGLSLSWNDATVNDGVGANIGAGILALLGIVVVVLGVVTALIGLVVVFVRRTRS